jgi:hypothetical protein
MTNPLVGTEDPTTTATQINLQADMEAATTAAATTAMSPQAVMATPATIATAINPQEDTEARLTIATATNFQVGMEETKTPQSARAVAMENLITRALVAREEMWEGACLEDIQGESLVGWNRALNRRGCKLWKGLLKRRVGRFYLFTSGLLDGSCWGS